MAASAHSAIQPVAGEDDLVRLDPDHPGFRDAVYRARRNQIARVALAYKPGDPVPRIEYTDDEHAVWRTVWEKLGPVHARHACRAYREAHDRLALDPRHIPQLADVNPQLKARTGFQMVPVAGLVTSRVFLGQLGQSTFLSTQYIRHASRPLYTPEPDVVHELIGHAASLCDPELAGLNRLFGQQAASASDDDITVLERLYWYTLEFGLVDEDGQPRAYGSGLLSSFGELGRFESEAFLKPFDPDEAAARPYDPTDYQAILYVVPSLAELRRTLTGWLDRGGLKSAAR
jgi:phenylalanine-4-hydroxylase